MISSLKPLWCVPPGASSPDSTLTPVGRRGEIASDFFCAMSLQSCDDRGGVSYQSLLKYIGKKYPGMEIEKKKFLIKKAMKKHLEKGTIKQVEDARQQGRRTLPAAPRNDPRLTGAFAKPSNMSFFVLSVHQLKGKGLSGTFAIRNKPVLSKVSWSPANIASRVEKSPDW